MKNRNKVFVIVVALSLCIISLSAVWGYNQVSKRKNDYIRYTQAKESVKSEADVESAIKELDEIEKIYGESDVIKVDKATIYLKVEDTKNAQKEIEKALKINRRIESNVGFMLTYGEIALANKDIESVKSVIDKIEHLIDTTEDLKLSEENENKLKELKKTVK